MITSVFPATPPVHHRAPAVALDPAEALAAADLRAAQSPRNHWLRLEAALLCQRLGDPAGALRRLEAIAHSPMIGAAVIAHHRDRLVGELAARPQGLSRRIDTPADALRRQPPQSFLRSLPSLRADRSFPSGFPFEMALPALMGNRNDYSFIAEAANQTSFCGPMPRLRLHVVAHITDEAGLQRLAQSLAAQTWPRAQMRLTVFRPRDLVAPPMPVPVNWQFGQAWTLPRERQAALLAEGADLLFFLGPGSGLDATALERAARWCAASGNILLPLQPLAGLVTADQLDLSVFSEKGLHRDWSGQRFPFRALRSLDFALPAARFLQVGGFDPRFRSAGCAAGELGFRIFNSGSYFIPLPVDAPIPPAPPAPSQDTELFRQLCPNPWDRKQDGRFEVPKVSIYIPVWNASRFIVDAVSSVLDQDFEDLEVCLANDGSPDHTLEVLEHHFGAEPQVRWVSRRNGGIGCASNAAIRLARGLYIGQLDSDDRLKPGAVRRLAGYLDDHADVGCVYSSCERVDAEGYYLQNEYSYPVFSREKMLLTSIAHHFRMFRRQVWERTETFREDIVNAVDYDMFLKMSEVTRFHHIEEMLYQRRWHGENTSNVNEAHQTGNTHVVQRRALERLGLDGFWDVHVPNPALPRTVTYRRKGAAQRVFFWPDYSRSNPYQRLLYGKARALTDFIGAEIDVVLKAAQDNQGLVQQGLGGKMAFHLHWLNKILEPAGSLDEAETAARDFLHKFARLKTLGVRLIWTIHNVVSHDLPWHDTEVRLARGILELVDAVHVHSQASLPEIEAVYSVPRDKLRVLRHGAYVGFYPDYIDRKTARATLELAEDDDVILFLGQIRPYKGVEPLIDAVRRLLRDRPRTLLLLAGQMRDDIFSTIKEPLTAQEQARIRLVNRFIDDAELQLFFRAADLTALPYRSILTSGSLLLSLSFGTPALVPAVGMTRELLQGSQAGRLYSGDPSEIEPELRAFLAEKDAGHLPQMRSAAAVLAQATIWEDFGTVVEDMTLKENAAKVTDIGMESGS